MITYEPNRDIVTSDADVLVNTVNTVGTMGKGLALAMKKVFPELMPAYTKACAGGRMEPGIFQVLPVKSGQQVINLASKQHWRNNSRYEWVGAGLVYLNRYLADGGKGHASICMPLPGCGNGGLEEARVHQMIRVYLHRAMEAGVNVRLAAQAYDPLEDQPFFAGVGARKTPESILALMAETSSLMTEAGFRLRSGGAIGADSAFWEGAREADPGGMEIFLPKAKKHIPDGIVRMDPVFERLAKNFHTYPEGITPDPNNPNDKRHYYLKLMSRNGNQVFGEDFRNPSNAVICWTPGGEAGGGTGQAIRLANSVGIPVIDLGKPELQGISAADVRDMAIGLITEFRASRALPQLSMSCEPALH